MEKIWRGDKPGGGRGLLAIFRAMIVGTVLGILLGEFLLTVLSRKILDILFYFN